MKRISGQSGRLTIPNVGTFGVTRARIKTQYTNADTTVTTSGAYEEFMPIARGRTYEIEVPFDGDVTGIEMALEAFMFPANTVPSLPTITYVIQSIAGGATYRTSSGSGLLESYELDDDARDALRLVFTVRMTGTVTVT